LGGLSVTYVGMGCCEFYGMQMRFDVALKCCVVSNLNCIYNL